MENFKEGEKVTWTVRKLRKSRNGSQLKISSRTGKITKVTGDICTVRYRGNDIEIHSSRLTRDGEVTELTAFVMDYHKREVGEKS